MKKKLFFTVLVSIFLAGSICGNAQEFYERNNNNPSFEEVDSWGDGGILGAKPDPTPDPLPEDKPTPVGDGIWILVGAVSIYGIVLYRRGKKASGEEK
jgi:hypothetical protein